MAKAFLKWVGGKRRALPHLRKFVPKSFVRYGEPFFGGGSLFFDIAPPRALISDSNWELVETLRAVRDFPEMVIRELGKIRYDREVYYEWRAMNPRTMANHMIAARMIYLNHAGFNGLYRTNGAGEFNVPFGKYVNPLICDAERLRACSALLMAEVEIEYLDFAAALKRFGVNDFVYLDPPFAKVAPGSFTKYGPRDFGPDKQVRLAEILRDMAKAGVKWVLSNADTPEVRKLYEGFEFKSLSRAGTVSSDPKKRGKVGEVLVRSACWEAAA